MTEPEKGSEPGKRRYATAETIERVGLVAIILGVLPALVQANTDSSDSPMWVTVFIGIALVGVGLRIEAAIRAS